MRRFKRGLALFIVLALMFSATACQERSLEDAKSWEDAVEICLGKYGVDVYEMEGSSIRVMIRDIGPEMCIRDRLFSIQNRKATNK